MPCPTLSPESHGLWEGTGVVQSPVFQAVTTTLWLKPETTSRSSSGTRPSTRLRYRDLLRWDALEPRGHQGPSITGCHQSF